MISRSKIRLLIATAIVSIGGWIVFHEIYSSSHTSADYTLEDRSVIEKSSAIKRNRAPQENQNILRDSAHRRPLGNARDDNNASVPKLDRSIAEMVGNIEERNFLSGAGAKQIDEFKLMVASIAEDNDSSVQEVLAKSLKFNPKVADGIASLISKAYFDEPDVVVTSFLKGLSGKTRSFSMAAYASKLFDVGSSSLLKAAYDHVPPSQDRSSIASKYTNMVAQEAGIKEALVALREFDLEEEKQYSFIGLYSYVRKNRDSMGDDELDDFYGIARDLGREAEARSRTLK